MTRIVIILNTIKAVLYTLCLIIFTVLLLIAAFRLSVLYGFIAVFGLGMVWMKFIKIEDKR